MHGHEVFREFEDAGDPTPFGAAPASEQEAVHWEELDEAGEGEVAGARYPGQPGVFAATLTATPGTREQEMPGAELEADEEEAMFAELSVVDETEP